MIPKQKGTTKIIRIKREDIELNQILLETMALLKAKMIQIQNKENQYKEILLDLLLNEWLIKL